MGIKYKSYSSLYESYYLIWNGIDFDKEKLVKFLKRLKWLKLLSIFPRYKSEYQILQTIFQSYDVNKLQGLLNNDEDIVRISIIEKLSRIGSIDIIVNGVYNRETYRQISNLPLEDYKLVLKRVEELVTLAQKTTIQSDNNTNNLPGT